MDHAASGRFVRGGDGLRAEQDQPLQREQSKMEKNTTNGLSIVLSLVLGVYVAAGMASTGYART